MLKQHFESLTRLSEVKYLFPHSALLLNSVMWAFRAEFVAARATDFISMIKECDEAGFPKVKPKSTRTQFMSAQCTTSDLEPSMCV